MNNNLDFDPVESLKQAVISAFPAREDFASLQFEGSYAQAWQAFARLLSVSQENLAVALAPVFGVPHAGPLSTVESDALGQIKYALCQELRILPLRLESNQLVIATSNPIDSNTVERIHFLINRPVRWVLAAPQSIEDAIYASFSREASNLARSVTTSRGVNLGDGFSAVDEHVIVKLGRSLITRAIEMRASDLHIQPFLGGAVVRIRVDGKLHRLTMLPDAVAVTLIRHFKARSGMESTNSQIPQDGRMELAIGNHDYDLRLSSLPSSHGERLAIRILDQSRVHRLSNGGFSLAAMQMLRRLSARPAGMVIFTGPTGSGKTSTLYSMLSELNQSSVNIITVENPVEYKMAGISQVEVNEKAGRGFSAALRSILRQDPDILLIGEIRDKETAEIAAHAALTGHLVLTTLHTNDAMTAIPRLASLGLEPSLIADSVIAVVSQRLCRRLCPECKVPVTTPLVPEEKIFHEATRNFPGHRAVGCAHCNYTGYLGRLPIIEVIEMNPKLRDAVAVGEIRLAPLSGLREGGLKSLAASGALRVISGETTVTEILEAVGPTVWSDLVEFYGTQISSEALEHLPQRAVAGQGILLMTGDGALKERLEPLLQEHGFRLLIASTRDDAVEILKRDEDIVFIISDEIADQASASEAAEFLRQNRQAIAWARLPSIVLIPSNLSADEAFLHESGVMGTLMTKPIDTETLLAHIRRSQVR